MATKEKFEEAKRLYETANADQRYVLESLFPELAESEDEMIRKALLRYFEHYGSTHCQGVQVADILAWLEKQVHVDEDEIVKGIRRGVAISLMNHIDANSKGMCLSSMECEDIENAIVNEDWDKVYGYMKKKLEKQGEQKPVVPKFKVGDVIRNKWSNHTKKIVRIADDNSVYFLDDGMPGDYISAPISNQKNWELVEQKPAWSEEDETALGDALWCCKQAASIAKDENDMGNVWYAEKWLKSLKDRYTWKPSDDQIKALESECMAHFNYDLCRLYEQLKKLREE